MGKKFIAFVRENPAYLEQEYFNSQKMFDDSVYNKNGKMRFINQNKPMEQRPFRPFGPYSQDPLDHMLTQPTCEPFKIPKLWRRPKFKVQKHDIHIVEHLDEDEELKEVCNHTIAKGNGTRDEWMYWVWAMCGAGVKPEDIHRLSYEANSESYLEASCDAMINSFHQEKTTMGRHTLKQWASEYGYDVERHIEKVEVSQLLSRREDHMTWLDLLKKYHGSYHMSERQACDAIRADVSKVVHMIQGGSTVFAIYSNDENMFELTNTIPHLGLNIGDGEGKSTTITLAKMMKMSPLEFPLYNRLVFQPDPSKVKRNQLNIYQGFKAQLVSKVDMGKVQFFLDHIKTVWASDNNEHYLYLMSWLAHIIKTPGVNTKIAILLTSIPGTGKTLPCEFLINEVFGRELSLALEGLSKVTQQFNTSINGKIFTNVNELRTVDSDSFCGKFDAMKSLITDKHIQIEKKGIDPMSMDNHNNYLMTSNHEHTLKLEEHDRRYACFSVSECKVGDYEYFNRFADGCDTEGAGDHLYTYLLEYPEEMMVDLRQIPLTDSRKSMIMNSQMTPVRFLNEMTSDEPVDFFDVLNKERCISKGKIYSDYIAWCSQNGEKSQTMKTFLSAIKRKIKSEGLGRIPVITLMSNSGTGKSKAAKYLELGV
jgi:hypothetical protein